MALAGCQTTAALNGAGPSHVRAVEVVRAKENLGTVNLPEDVRVKTLRTAYRYSETGTEKVLKITLTEFHLKNPVASFLVGDNNRLSARTEVVDKASGQVEATFQSVVTSKSLLNGISGVVISAAQNPIEVEQQLASELAEEVLERMYGGDMAKQARERTSARTVVANYPRSYDDLRVEYRCRMIADTQNINQEHAANPTFEKIELPPECKERVATAARS